MRFLIIDASAAARQQVTQLLAARWPQAQCEVWDPSTQGPADPQLARPELAAILLSSEPDGDDGIAWVAALRRQADAPPVVLLTERGGEYLAVKAMKAGAADFLRKDGLADGRLVRSIEEALTEREAQRVDRTGAGPNPAFLRTLEIDARQIGLPAEQDAAQVPGYRTLRMIGEGGMAQVYLCEREHDGLQLVLKVLDPALRRDEVFLQRFVREYKLIASIENEHVARIYDQGFTGRHAYIAMEYFSGGDLKARLAQGVTSLGALRIASQIARALDAVHARGIVHRDLKPQNILFRETGRLAIADFGLARDMAVESTLTQHGEILATPRYMSPEQCMAGAVDHRSDLYSLGVIFFEMLTGKRLYDAETAAGLIYQHVHGPVPQLPAKLSGYQPIVNRLLAKSPADRFQSARELFATIAI